MDVPPYLSAMRRIFLPLLPIAALLACESPIDPGEQETPPLGVAFVLERPESGERFLDEGVWLLVRTHGSYPLDSVVVEVAGVRDVARPCGGCRGNAVQTWSFHLNGTDALEPGEYAVQVTAFNEDGRTRTEAFQFVRDPRPVVSWVEPTSRGHLVMTGTRLVVSCDDPTRGDCASLWIEARHPNDEWTTVASITNAATLDTVVDWNELAPKWGQAFLRVGARSESGREPALDHRATLEVRMASTAGLLALDTVPGQIEDVDARRILMWVCAANYHCSRPPLRIYDRATRTQEATFALPYYDYPPLSVRYRPVKTLTSRGAMTMWPTGMDLSDAYVENMGILGDLQVAGDFAVFTHLDQILLRDHRAPPEDRDWTRRIARVADQAQTEIAVSSNGTVVYTEAAGEPVVRHRAGVVDTVAASGHLVAVTDSIIAYNRSTGDDVFDWEVVVVDGGSEQVALSMATRFGELVANGRWLVVVPNANTPVSLRYPSGEVVQVSDWHVTVEELSRDGRLLYIDGVNAGPLFLYDPVSRTNRKIAEYAERAGFDGDEIWVAFGGYLFRVE